MRDEAQGANATYDSVDCHRERQERYRTIHCLRSCCVKDGSLRSGNLGATFFVI